MRFIIIHEVKLNVTFETGLQEVIQMKPYSYNLSK